jgi:hypothetical protein
MKPPKEKEKEKEWKMSFKKLHHPIKVGGKIG